MRDSGDKRHRRFLSFVNPGRNFIGVCRKEVYLAQRRSADTALTLNDIFIDGVILKACNLNPTGRFFIYESVVLP